ncbi:MAG: Flp pilus assembly complex ATPase component TadA [Victivallales bacterium]|nr:Flp pilus assembly complex ATPase component TadA [Victivallales bacterium]
MNGNSVENLDSKIENLIRNASLAERVRDFVRRKWHELRQQKLNIMVTGATGSGKSSTINAMFNMGEAKVEEVATVGTGPDPETMGIVKYEIGNLTLWDSPGLGDGREADVRHAHNIIEKLNERDAEGNYLIDLVLVVIDGSTRDLGTSFELINKIIIPNLGEDKERRILVAVNQADAAMGGRHWNYEENCPDATLVRFLDEKCESVRRRIYEGTGVDVPPIYYAAGYKEEGGVQERPYNLTKLLCFILEHIPPRKRLVATMNVNSAPEMWQANDRQGYSQKCQRLTVEGVTSWMAAGAGLGAAVGSLFPGIGTAVGTAVGTLIGGAVALFKSFFS